jgi:hypothetical protein
MNKHEYKPDKLGWCTALVGGASSVRCGLPEPAFVHQDLPPVRDENDRRPKERQDF